jgi:hypothetical protein
MLPRPSSALAGAIGISRRPLPAPGPATPGIVYPTEHRPRATGAIPPSFVAKRRQMPCVPRMRLRCPRNKAHCEPVRATICSAEQALRRGPSSRCPSRGHSREPERWGRQPGVSRMRWVRKACRTCRLPILKYNRHEPFRRPIFPLSGRSRRECNGGSPRGALFLARVRD